MWIKYLLFLALLVSSPAWSATYYVDFAGGSDAAAGTSTGAAWKRIPWDAAATGTSAARALAAGDTVCVKPDTTYSVATINPHDSGTTGNYITIDGSPTCWGSGTANATFTGNPAAWTGIWNFIGSNHQWIKLKDMNLGPSTGICIVMGTGSGDTHSNLYFQNIVANNCDGSMGVYIQHTAGTQSNITFDGLTVSNSNHIGMQVDSCGTGLLITNSTFANNGSTGNEDGLFIGANDGNCTNWVVSHSKAYGNGVGGDGSGFDTSNNGGYSNSGGVFDSVLAYNNGNTQISSSSDDASDNVTIRNSIVYGTNNWADIVLYENIKAYLYNNTCGGGDASSPCYEFSAVDGTPCGELKNNIAYGTYSTAATYSGCVTASNNLFGTNPLFVGSPALPNPAYFTLQAGSPAIDNGADLSAKFATDYLGNTRSGTWDIGAYEYGGSASLDTTPNAFSFTDNTGAARSTVIYSTPITVLGVDNVTSITSSGTGCSYQVNGAGSWLTTGGDNVSLNDTIQMKTASSANYSTQNSCRLTLNGNVADTWHVTTLAAADVTIPPMPPRLRSISMRGGWR